MTIHIEDLKFQCIIGILDFERTTPQDVIINIQLDYEYTERFINYVDVTSIIKSQMIDNEFFLIEDALKTIVTNILEKFSSIKNLNLKITKPSILPDCKVSVSTSYNSQS